MDWSALFSELGNDDFFNFGDFCGDGGRLCLVVGRMGKLYCNFFVEVDPFGVAGVASRKVNAQAIENQQIKEEISDPISVLFD